MSDRAAEQAARTISRMRDYVQAVVDPSKRAPVMRALAERSTEELANMNPVEAEHLVEETLERLSGTLHQDERHAVTCASRASALAMTQTRMVAARLAQRGIATTILNVQSTGDRIQDRPIAEIGSVNVWVKELEVALEDGRADYAVHSCKDMPGQVADGMQIAAISAREDARDAFCSERYARFEDLPAGARVGTSSARRRAQLHALRSDLRYDDIRGNVDTRLRKLRDGDFDAIVLAMAGLNRLGIAAKHTVAFDAADIVPAVGQGALAVETLESASWIAGELRAAVEDLPARLCVEAERAALLALRAGCSAPLGVHAQLLGGRMIVDAAFGLADGGMLRERVEGSVSQVEDAREIGARIAALIARGSEGR
jgi:hydroxymethylbilane synthase